MQDLATSQTSFLGLIGHLGDEIKLLIRQETELAKTELSEKASRLGRNAVWLGLGGTVGLGALIIVLASLASLLSYAFESAGIDRSLAFFIGALIIGGITALVGAGLIGKALKSFSRESLAPRKTMDSLKKLQPTAAQAGPEPVPHSTPKLSSDEIQSSVDLTRREVGQTAEEITQRMKPRYVGQVMKRKIQEHPVRTSLIGAGAGLLSFLLIWRRRHA